MRRQHLLLAVLGMIGGASAGYASRTQTSGWTAGHTSAARAELASESGYYLRIEPARLSRDGGRERLTIASRVGTTKAERARSIASVQIEDDRGQIIERAKVSPRMELAPRTERAGGEIVLPALADGWYRLRAQAVFVDPAKPREALGSETDSLYLHVEDGETFIIDMAEWFAGSNANLGRNL